MTNRILASLPERELQLIQPHFSNVDLPTDFAMGAASDPDSPFCYFLTSGVASYGLSTEGTPAVEIGLIGREGVVGISNLTIGNSRGVGSAHMLIPGSALRIEAAVLEGLASAEPNMRTALRGFVDEWLDQMAGNVLAGFRPTEQKLARWLLLLGDKAEADELNVTQEQISRSLGADRRDITQALQLLTALGCVRSDQRQVRIIDRPALVHETQGSYGDAKHGRELRPLR